MTIDDQIRQIIAETSAGRELHHAELAAEVCENHPGLVVATVERLCWELAK